MRIRWTTSTIFGLSLMLALPMALLAQGPGQDPLQKHLFPPELVMQNQKALQITDRQRETIIDHIQAAQSQFTSHQWKMQAEVESLAAMLEEPAVDEAAVVEQAEIVLHLEKQIKITHLILAVRIKNALSPEQQLQLQDLQRRHRLEPQRRQR